jgi:hypothetical protein
MTTIFVYIGSVRTEHRVRSVYKNVSSRQTNRCYHRWRIKRSTEQKIVGIHNMIRVYKEAFKVRAASFRARGIAECF